MRGQAGKERRSPSSGPRTQSEHYHARTNEERPWWGAERAAAEMWGWVGGAATNLRRIDWDVRAEGSRAGARRLPRIPKALLEGSAQKMTSVRG